MNASRRGDAALDKALALHARIVRDRGATPLRVLAEEAGVAWSTARRMVAALERRGLLARVGRGRYAAGHALARLSGFVDTRMLLARAGRAALRALAREAGATAHLGVLENDMVTYLVKEHGGTDELFTREGAQLEAYCSGVGKVLLAALPAAALDAYLAAGPFIALTARTTTAPAALRAELAAVRKQDFAVDDEEVARGLYCVAAPVRDADGAVVAAISLSSMSGALKSAAAETNAARLHLCARQIANALNGAPR